MRITGEFNISLTPFQNSVSVSVSSLFIIDSEDGINSSGNAMLAFLISLNANENIKCESNVAC